MRFVAAALKTVYRRAIESQQTRERPSAAFRSLIDDWLLEEEALGQTDVNPHDPHAVTAKVGKLLEEQLNVVSATQQ